MANTITSGVMNQGTPSITQMEAREVGDQIRYCGFGNAVLSMLIQNSMIDNTSGKLKQSKGVISKRAVENIRYEQYTRSPRPYKFTVASGTEISSSGVVLNDANGLQPGMTLFNPKTSSRCRVEVVSTNTITGSSFGATTFSCAAGDVLLLMAPAVPSGSEDAIIVNGTDDNTYNTLQYSRLGVSISWVLQAVKQIAGGERLTREKMYLLWEFLADLERSWIFSDYTSSGASKNTTTGAQTGWTGEYPTTRGILAQAANGYSMEGQITLEKLRKNVPLKFGDTVNDNQDVIALVSNELFARIQELMQDKHYNTEGEGTLDKFGIKCYNFVTSGPNIKFVKHSAFNVSGIDNQMLLFVPENLEYVHLKGHDMKPNNKIQDNAAHTQIDELYCYHGISSLDGGKSILSVTDCF